MNVNVDRAALAGVAISSIIAVSASDGRYEPFESVLGIVLAILLAAYYRPSTPATSGQAWIQALPAAAVGALTSCLVMSFPLDQLVTQVGNTHRDSATLAVSWAMSIFWVVAFVPMVILFRYAFLGGSAAGHEPGHDTDSDSSES